MKTRTVGLVALALALASCGVEDLAAPAADDVEVVLGALTCTASPLAPKGAAASSQENATLGAGNAIDGNAGTRWSSAFSDPQWIYVDYGAPVVIKEVKITWEAAYAKNYQVQVATSTNGPWTNVYTKTNFGGGTDDTTGLKVTGRYLRVYGTARATAYGYSIFEIAAWGNTDLACTPVCTAGATQCAGAQIQTCDANGVWPAPVACASGGVCDGSACVAQTTSATPAATYPFDSNSYTPTAPNAVDVQGGGYHAHASNVTLAAGKIGNGFVFNGAASTSATASKVTLGTYTNSSGSSIFTNYIGMCMWVKPSANASGKAQPLFNTSDGDFYYEALAIGGASPPAGSCESPNELFLESNVPYQPCERSGLSVAANAWSFVCYMHDGPNSAGRFWVNGTGATSPFTSVWPNVPTSGDKIGFSNAASPSIYSGAFNGSIDDVMLFNTPLTDAVVTALYNAGKGAQPRPAAHVGVGTTGVTATQLSQGHGHACAVLSDGTLWCWGSNLRGQLGLGTSGNTVRLAQQVPGIAAKKVVALGLDATCALLTDGTVKCWGDNTVGQMGTGATSTSVTATPTAVAGITGATDLAAGYGHACALLSDKTVKCWGFNGMGQIGNGAYSATPAAPQFARATTGVAGSKLSNVIGLMSGTVNNHTCAVIGDGTAACWGANETYQLGIQLDGHAPDTCSNQSCAVSPHTVVGLSGKTVKAIGAGERHTCFLITAGTVWCVGGNDSMQLGIPYSDAQAPTNQAAGITNGVTITSGKDHNCVTKTDGTAQCFGANNYGQAGDGLDAGAYQNAVTVIAEANVSTALGNVTAIDAGRNGTCAITHGVITCWGANDTGQVGVGGASTGDILVPYYVQ
jgi:alpha-tubulin suppressor-like RCC1 family protein